MYYPSYLHHIAFFFDAGMVIRCDSILGPHVVHSHRALTRRALVILATRGPVYRLINSRSMAVHRTVYCTVFQRAARFKNIVMPTLIGFLLP